jgi:hypothetical protein
MSKERWNPHPVPTATPKRPPEPLWKLRVAGVTWSCELRFHGESHGWEALLLRNGELFSSPGAFVTKAATCSGVRKCGMVRRMASPRTSRPLDRQHERLCRIFVQMAELHEHAFVAEHVPPVPVTSWCSGAHVNG